MKKALKTVGLMLITIYSAFSLVKEKNAVNFQRFVVKMWSNQETTVQKQVKNPCEVVAYAMHSSGKNSLAVGLSPYTFP